MYLQPGNTCERKCTIVPYQQFLLLALSSLVHNGRSCMEPHNHATQPCS
jgi:hypothetical protein